MRAAAKDPEAALRESELRYRSVLGLMPAAVYTCDAPTGVITFYNEHAAVLWGRVPRPGDSDERFCGSFRLWHPDGRPMPHEQTPMALAMREGREFRNQEVVIERPDGSRITALVNIDPLRDAEGRVTGAINVFHDVTERRRAEHALREEAYTLEKLNAVGKTLAAELSLEKTVQAVTDAATELSGAKFGAFFYNVRNEAGESYMLYALSGAPRQAFERFGIPRKTALFGPTFEGRGPVRIGDVAKDARYGKNPPHHGMPKGHLPVRSYLAAPVVSRTGEVIGGLFFGHPEPDVFSERAERLVTGIAAQAAVAIDNARLYEESRRLVAELREADRRKDEFMAMLAHELRNPLSTINLGTDLLKLARLDDAKAHFAVPAIERQARQLQRLVDDMLDMARATYGKLTLQKQPLELFETAKAVAAVQAGKDGSVRLDILGGQAWVNGDPVRVQQMIGNLLENAVKYGGRNICVRVCREGDWSRLSVEDDGQGIAPELLRDLFKPFVQGEQLLDRAQGGLGLGLALVQRLAAMHGGGVAAHSEGPGRGSRFTLSLPAGEAPAVEGALASSPAAIKQRRVLVVEDEGDVRDMLRLLLESEGHQVSVASNGAEGLALLGASLPDVALVDIGLPGMDGYELARRVRLLPEGKGVRLIAVTGYGQEKDRQRADEAGFDLHLTKPVRYEELVQAFER